MPVELFPSSGSDYQTYPLSIDKVGSAYYPVSKLDIGGDGVSIPVVAGQATSANSLPVTVASDQFISEDIPHASGDKGIQVLAVRRDSASADVSNDGDYAALSVTSQGYLRVYDSANATPLSNISSQSSTHTTYLSALNGAVRATSSAAPGDETGMVVQAIRDDTTTDLGAADGEFTPLRVNQRGELWIANGTRLDPTNDSVSIKRPSAQISKSFNATTTQTGTDVWSPASGKKIRVTYLQIGSYGTTAARLILWFGANADTTFSEGTDQTLFKASFAPSATTKPGCLINFNPPFEAATADHELHVTTDAGISVDIVVAGYEE